MVEDELLKKKPFVKVSLKSLNMQNEYKFIIFELKIDKLVSESVQFGFL